MALVLASFSVPDNWIGLCVKITVGAVVYAFGLFALDVMGIRSRILSGKFSGKKLDSPATIDLSALRYDILDTPEQIQSIAADWKALHARAGSPLFGHYDWFDLWLRHLSRAEGAKPCILTARMPSPQKPAGELRALLALG